MFAERFEQDGCLVIDRLFDPQLIARAYEEYERQYGKIDPAHPPPHMKVGAGRLQLPVQLRGAFLDPALYAHPMLMLVLSQIFRGHFVIDNVSIVTALPGAGPQRFHRDQPPLFPSAKQLDASVPCYGVTVGIPLVDLDEDTGTTELFPGTTAVIKAADEPPFEQRVLPLLKRGGCYFMDYRLWHRGQPNRSATARPILYIVYSRPWFTDVRNLEKHARFVIEREDLESVPPEHRPLFRRAAAKGLIDATIKDLGAEVPNAQPKA